MPHNHPVCLGRPLPFPFTDVGIYYLIDAKLLPLTLMVLPVKVIFLINQCSAYSLE